ncbi:DUF6456 domain-containing protein [Szabonella alba]|uniref:Helix-turn-helix domain-containing protein n=1 Tax=Szabonella alba TaxID=2804194 RepID=A0A8K0XZK1_9RHOB|nr:DUF6456 domain-containing protein [Szabonella alba]MBL4917205.1 helix-turn-helix domain-containing protein [Szabonella alba]
MKHSESARTDPTGKLPLPAWLPDAARIYLHHTESGVSLRQLALREGVHASTVLRQVRRYETRRDDPLVDEALDRLSRLQGFAPQQPSRKDVPSMTAPIRPSTTTSDVAGPAGAASIDEVTILNEGRRILRRLAEAGTVLAFAPDMEKAAVLRSLPDGQSSRVAVVDRAVAQVFALQEWISCTRPGRVSLYRITMAGRAALRQMIDRPHHAPPGLAEASASFRHHTAGDCSDPDEETTRRPRYASTESPVVVLARRRDKDGKPFLSADLVQAAERLREDFELAQIGPRVTQNWERFLTGGDRGGFRPDTGGPTGPRDARERVSAALRDLGPGLGDMVLRCCCFLEGLEAAEQRMGWSARSGKIVLRIALQRLRRHYDEAYGRHGPMIG